jgi:hypothetical protein
MVNGPELLPQRPFFSCDDDGFSVIDAAEMQQSLRAGQVTPVLKLKIGPGNIFESRPRKVVNRSGFKVSVQCDDDITVALDFDAESARKKSPEGEFVYLGGIDEGDDGKGWMAAG